jgi:two-component sensor histidine kinase
LNPSRSESPLSDDGAHARDTARWRSTLILIGAFWAFAALMLSIRALIIDSLPLSILGPRRLVTALLGALLCLGMSRVLEALRNRSFPERVVWGVAGAFLMSITLTLLTQILNRVLLPLPGWGPIIFEEAAQWVLVWLGYFLAWTGTHLALIYHWESQDHQRRAALLTEMAREAQIAALRYQLNPHFLFNTLNSISSLVMEHQNEEAEAMLLNLATFVRSTLTDEPGGTVSLREEIGLQRLYLDIEQARFGDRLKVEIDLPENLADTRLPALILQPLIENAIRHGVSNCEDQLRVRIAASTNGPFIEVAVEDDGKAAPTRRNVKKVGGAKGGLGLKNVGERLRAHYGEQGSLNAAPITDGGFRAVLAFPRAG